MKVWVITESAGYGAGDILRAICSTPEKATEWIAGQCPDTCELRHDLWSAETPNELRAPVPDTTPEAFEAWRKKWRAWREQYCSSLYDVEDYEVDE